MLMISHDGAEDPFHERHCAIRHAMDTYKVNANRIEFTVKLAR